MGDSLLSKTIRFAIL